MEKFAIIKSDEIIDNIKKYNAQRKILNNAYKDTAKEFGIEADTYYNNGYRLQAKLTENDLQKFSKDLIAGSTEEFKKSSKVCKFFLAKLKEYGYKSNENISFNMYYLYPNEAEGMRVTIKNVEGVYYTRMSRSTDFVLDEKFEEISGVEYYKAIEGISKS